MEKRAKVTAEILENRRIADGIFRMVLNVPFAKDCRPGQFVSVYSRDRSRLLPRPISLCGFDRETITLVYRVAGAGTEEFSARSAGEKIAVTGPLGNGFPIDEGFGKRVLMIGGGIGIPPLVAAGGQLAERADVRFACGYRSELFLTEEMKACGDLLIATEDGSAGVRGTVLDAVREDGASADVIFACGPKPMLRAVRDFAESERIPCWISMEERMACGVGACLGCVCGTRDEDSHSHVRNRRVCCDGPVFRAEEVNL